MKIRSASRAAVISVAAAVALSACTAGGGAGGAATVSTDRTLNLMMNAPPSDMSVGNSSGGETTLLNSIYDTLVILAPDGSIKPGVASSWAYSADHKTLTFHIRKGMKFTDGEKVDAGAVVASLNASKTGPATSDNFASVTDITSTDDYTVVLSLSSPDAALVSLLTEVSGVIGAPKSLGSADSKLWPTGSGPYILDKSKSVVGSKYVLERNPDYWNVSAYPFKTVIESIITDPTAAENALRSGQLDVLQSATASDVAQFPKAQFNSGDNKPLAIAVLWLADRDGTVVPALKEQKVRQAINLALDRETIAKKLLGPGNAATNQVFNPSGDVFSKSLLASQRFNVGAAKKLMAEAGYPNGFTVAMPSSVVTTTYESTLTQELGDIGIKVDWQSVPFEDFNSKVLAKTFGMYVQYNGYNTSPAVEAEGSMAGVFNPFNTTTPELTQLLNAANAAPDKDQAAAWGAVNKYFVDNAWFAPIASSSGFWLSDKNVKYTAPTQYGVNLLPYSPAN